MAVDVEGKTFVPTGALSKKAREQEQAGERLTALGAKIGGSIGKSPDLVIAGEKAGSALHEAPPILDGTRSPSRRAATSRPTSRLGIPRSSICAASARPIRPRAPSTSRRGRALGPHAA